MIYYTFTHTHTHTYAFTISIIAVTSDVQSVTATVVRESTIDIQCLFIHGSDAVGCKVVLVSDHPGVNNETVNLMRENASASAQLKLTHQLGCYQGVLAYTINVNNSMNNFIITEMLNFGTNNSCLGKKKTITQFKFNEHFDANNSCLGKKSNNTSILKLMNIIIFVLVFTATLYR